MKEVRYVITDVLGIHARPAGLLVKKLAGFSGDVRVGSREKSVDGKSIFAVMGLGLRHGDEMKLTFSGSGEDEAAAEIESFLAATL